MSENLLCPSPEPGATRKVSPYVFKLISNPEERWKLWSAPEKAFPKILSATISIQLFLKSVLSRIEKVIVGRPKKHISESFAEFYETVSNIPLKLLTGDQRRALYANYCASKIVSFYDTCLYRREFLYSSRIVYQSAACTIQHMLRSIQLKRNSRTMVEEGRIESARTIVRFIRGRFFKHDFVRYRELVHSISKISPKSLPLLLKVISPKEAEIAGDVASLFGIRVKLSNGIGEKKDHHLTIWPPRIVYKLVVLGPVIDQTSVLTSKCITRAPKMPPKPKPTNQNGGMPSPPMNQTSDEIDKFPNDNEVETGIIDNTLTTPQTQGTRIFQSTVSSNTFKEVNVLANVDDKIGLPLCKEVYTRVTSEWRAFDNPEDVVDRYVHSFCYDRTERINKGLNKIERRKLDWGKKRKRLINLKVRASLDPEFSDALQFVQDTTSYDTKEGIDSLVSWAACLDYESYLDEWFDLGSGAGTGAGGIDDLLKFP